MIIPTTDSILDKSSSLRRYYFYSTNQVRKHIVGILFFLFVSTFSFSPVFAQDLISLPLEMVRGIPFVRVKINQQELRFVLDLGTMTAVHLTRDVADALPHLRFTGRKIKSFDLAGKLNETDEFVIAALDVNGMTFSNVTGEIFLPWGMGLGNSSGPPADTSVLGLRFFENKKVLLNFANKTMLIGSDAHFPVADLQSWKSMPFELTDEGLIVVVTGKKQNYKLILDTAATISMIKSDKIIEHEDIQQCAFDLGDKPCKQITLHIPPGIVLRPLLVDLPKQFNADGIVGTDFFMKVAILIDFQNNSIFIKER